MYDGDVAAAFGLAPLDQSKPYTPTGIVEAVEAEDRDWRQDAACHPRHKPETMTIATWVDQFYPERGASVRPTVNAFCDGCPVQEDCLDEAMTTPFEKQGIWGGTAERARRRLRKRAGAPSGAGRHKGYDALHEEIIRLANQGMTDTAIANRAGVTRMTVANHRNRAGLSRNRRGVIDPERGTAA